MKNCVSEIVTFILQKKFQPLQKLFTAVLKKNIHIGAVKQEILVQLKQDSNIELPYERWNFMECSEDWVGISLVDDEKLLPSIYKAICIQELPDENLLAGRIIVYVRKWDRSELHLHDPQQINISTEDFSQQLLEKVKKILNKLLQFFYFMKSIELFY